MIDKKVDEIINRIDNSEKVKRFKELEKIILSNEKYISLVNEFNKNKEKYEKENRLDEEILKYRKELFKIEEVKEYSKLEGEIRLESKKISKIISSIVNKHNC